MCFPKRRGMRRDVKMSRVHGTHWILATCQTRRMKTRKMSRIHGVWLDGSFTVEASLILPFVLILLFGMMGLLFGLRDQVIVRGQVLGICARGMQDGQDSLDDQDAQGGQGSLSEQFEGSLRERMWTLQVKQGKVKARSGKVTVTARLGRNGKQYSHKMSLGRRKPSTVRRYIGREGERQDDS